MSDKQISGKGNTWAQNLHEKTQHVQQKSEDHKTSQTQGERATDGNEQPRRQRKITETKA